jgi:asparagine synthase (glutamine-hydrolysing)
MCGLAGFIDFSANADVGSLLADVRRMTDTLKHRGPDDADYWADTGIALGHRRLAILDLSPAGRQPMVSACGRYRIVFNGEIYNFGILRADLETLGHRFRGHSDTEILLAACAQWGVEETLKRCVGMFAFALWDSKARTLSLARDRLGEKPLYYGWVGDRFVFASELRALREAPRWQGELSRAALTQFLRYGYVPAPLSICEGIYKLPPAAFLTVKSADGAPQAITPAATASWAAPGLQPKTYWSVRKAAEAGLAKPFGDIDEAVSALEQLLGEAVTQQMVADVPLGAFLSAGIDSSTVVALMQHHSDRPVKTFTVGFEEKAFNEAEYAKAIAGHLGTEHTEIYVTADDALRHVPTLATVYDEPFADPSQLPTLLLSELVRRHVTVCLTGDGGDELFGGYTRYWWSKRLWSVLKPFPALPRRWLAKGINTVPSGFWNTLSRVGHGLLPSAAKGPQSTPAEKLFKIADAMSSSDTAALYRNLVSYWKQPALVVLDGLEPDSVIDNSNRLANAADEVEHMQYWDQIGYLADDNLVKVDRASMAVSLETRVPLLDHRVVELSWRVPVAMKHREGVGKWLLRQVLYRHVPRAMMERPKMGFSMPLGRWLHTGLRDWAESLLSERALRRDGILDPAPIRRAWSDHLAGRRNLERQLWTVLMFQSWLAANSGAPR